MIVIDGFERFAHEAPLLSSLTASAPNLSLLVTSRETLHVDDECECPLEPLAPETAVELFVERVRDSVPSFETAEHTREIAEICRRVDGLPLAVELAAARVKLLGVTGLAAALESELDVLTGGRLDAPARQRTLHTTVEWSYELLAPREQRTFCALSVFVDGFSTAAAAEVCDADLDVLASLLDKNLVSRRTTEGGTTRFHLLHTLRAFGSKRLDDSVRTRHLVYFGALAGDAGPRLWTGGQAAALRLLDLESENLRAALAFALGDRGDIRVGARMAVSLHDYWDARGHYTEAEDWLTKVLNRRAELQPDLAAWAATALAVITGRRGQRERVIQLLEEAAAVFAEVGDVLGETRALGVLAAWLVGSPEPEAQDRGWQAVARVRVLAECGDDPRTKALAYAAVGETASFTDPPEAVRFFKLAAGAFAALGDGRNEAIAYYNIGELSLDQGGIDQAEKAFRRVTAVGRELGDPMLIAAASAQIAAIALLAGRDDEARTPLREAATLNRMHGFRDPLTLVCVALALANDGREEEAHSALAAYRAVAAATTNSFSGPVKQELEQRVRAKLDTHAATAEPGDDRVDLVLHSLVDRPV